MKLMLEGLSVLDKKIDDFEMRLTEKIEFVDIQG